MYDFTVTILRGVPGAGKSTWAKNQPRAFVVSADNFFMTHEGKYEYRKELIGAAHNQCMRQFLDALARGEPQIIVDNTNIRLVDMAPYVAVAKACSYNVKILEFRSVSPLVAAHRNVHGVPLKTVERMALGWEKLPPHWKQYLAAPIDSEHAQHGRGTLEDGPHDPDCPCRGTVKQPECSLSGCGFCGTAMLSSGYTISPKEEERT